MTSRKGQAMLESALAVLFIAFLFLALFQLQHLLTAKILADHGAARAARARTVGFNDFMCRKSARVAVIPIAGRRIVPGEELPDADEVSRVPIYLQTYDESLAAGVLDYARWHTMKLEDGALALDIPRFFCTGDGAADPIAVRGEAEIERHYPFYLNDQGL